MDIRNNHSRRSFIQTTAAAGALASIGRPVFAQQAEFAFKWANNIPATHPSTIRIKEAAEATGCRVARLGAPRIPVGYAPMLEDESRLSAPKVARAARRLLDTR